MFDEAGYVWNQEKTYKYKLFTEEYTGKVKDKQDEIRQRQVLIYWNKAEGDMSRRKRCPYQAGSVRTLIEKDIAQVIALQKYTEL